MIGVGYCAEHAESTGEENGRRMLAEALHARYGAPGPVMSHAATLNVADLAAACLWLRATAMRLSAEVGMSLSQIRLDAPMSEVSHDAVRGWTLAHEFMCGTGPGAEAGKVVACCHSCLVLLSATVCGMAAALVYEDFSGKWESAASYILASGPLPAFLHGEAAEPAGTVPDVIH